MERAESRIVSNLEKISLYLVLHCFRYHFLVLVCNGDPAVISWSISTDLKEFLHRIHRKMQAK